MRIPLIRPFLPAQTKALVCDVLDSGFLVEGRMTAKLEDMSARYLGASHCIAVDSCTRGLEIALRCLGVGPGDEVITSDYTFPATIQSILLVGATAVVVGIDPRSMLLDIEAVASAITPATKAVMPVATFGNPIDYDQLNALKSQYGFHVIEDAACAFGAKFKDRRIGTQADITSFSLHPRKFITTARGGINTTENSEWASWMRSFKCFGKGLQATREDTSFNQLGANAMLPDVLSAIGVAQMEIVDEMLERRLHLAACYRKRLSGVAGITFPKTAKGGMHSIQSFCIFVNERDHIMKRMRDKGIEAQIGTYSMHMHKAFLNTPSVRFTSMMENSRWAFDHCLTLPLYHEMTTDELDDVVNNLIRLLS